MSKADVVIAAAAEGQYGVFSHKQAIDAGFSAAGIQRRRRAGVWRRVGSGVYAIAGLSLSFESRVLARILEVGDAVASHRTAAALYRLDGFNRRTRIEVMIFDRRGAERDVHRPRVWFPEDKATISRIPATSIVRTLFDLAPVCRTRELEIAFDDALRKGIVSVEQMAERFEAVRRPGIRGLKKLAVIIADRSTNELEDSELETEFRKLITKAGLPLPVPQYDVWHDDGVFIGEFDFAYPRARLAIELDSWTHHGGRRPFEADRAKDYELLDAGWDCLRVTKKSVRQRGDRVVAIIARRLAAFGSARSRVAT